MATVGSVTTLYPGRHYEYVNGTTYTKYYYAGSDLVAFERSSGYGSTAGYGRRFVFRDHLNSTSVVVNGSNVTLWQDLYKPYGDLRYTYKSSSSLALQTQYRYTSQRMEVGVGAPSPVGGLDRGLYFYGARWYDPSLARFIQADTVVPEPGNPQSLNRYSYVLNNPLRYTDGSGHCGPLTPVCIGLFLTGMALLLQGDAPDTNITPEDIASQRLGGALLVGGAVLTGSAAVAGVTSVGTAGTAAATSACADGDCTNEAQAVIKGSQGVAQTAQSVWRLDPLKRGQEIEHMLGRSPQLSQNFPVINRFEKGVATSIKSIDLGAKSYQNVGTLTSTVKGYVNDLAGWQGVRWGGVEIRSTQIAARELLLAIPQGATQAQLAAVQQLQQWASTVGVTVNVTVVP